MDNSAKDVEFGELRTNSKSSRTQAADWHWLRTDVARIVGAERFDMGMAAVILVNMVFVVIDTDARAAGSSPAWSQPMAYGFLAVFIVELSMRFFVQRDAYFKSNFNLLDCCIIFMDIASQVVNDAWETQPQLSVLNAFRICRLLRVFRALSAFRELWLMLHGLASALKAMFWACTLILSVLLIFSVVGVELIRPYNEELAQAGQYDSCEQCAEAFSSVKETFFTMFLMVFIGDLWSDVAYPLVKRQPLIGIVFMTAFCIVHLGLLNLILTVIVDGAAQARSDSLEEQVQKKKTESNVAREKLLQVCAQMDHDGSGELALDELAMGYTENAEFASTLQMMDVGVDDLEIVFGILDEDKSGAVTFTEFVDQLHKMKSQESHTLLIFIKHYVNEIRENVTEQLELVRDKLMIKMSDHEERVDELLAIAKESSCAEIAKAVAKDPNAHVMKEAYTGQLLQLTKPSLSYASLTHPERCTSRPFRQALARAGSRRLHPDRSPCVVPLGDDALSRSESRQGLGCASPCSKNGENRVPPRALPVLLGPGSWWPVSETNV